jgi:hypothetical protein
VNTLHPSVLCMNIRTNSVVLNAILLQPGTPTIGPTRQVNGMGLSSGQTWKEWDSGRKLQPVSQDHGFQY